MSTLAIYFNPEYAKLLNSKIIGVNITQDIEFIYSNLSYLEYKLLIQNLKLHKLYKNFIREETTTSYNTIIRFKIDKNKFRLLSLIKQKRFSLLTLIIQNHINIFCNIESINQTYSNLANSKIIMKEYNEMPIEAQSILYTINEANSELFQISENPVNNLESFEY